MSFHFLLLILLNWTFHSKQPISTEVCVEGVGAREEILSMEPAAN